MKKGAQPTICVIDDDADVRKSLRALLESHDFQVADYPSAGDFIAGRHPENIGCFLLDLQMPGLSGLEFLEQARKSGVNTPAIILTANGKTPPQRLARANVLAILRKPAAAEELLQWVRKALEIG